MSERTSDGRRRARMEVRRRATSRRRPRFLAAGCRVRGERREKHASCACVAAALPPPASPPPISLRPGRRRRRRPLQIAREKWSGRGRVVTGSNTRDKTRVFVPCENHRDRRENRAGWNPTGINRTRC